MKTRIKWALIAAVYTGSMYHGAGAFTFTKNKTEPDGVLQKSFLQELADTFSPRIFFETGTFNGKSAALAAQYFAEVHTVELGKEMFEEARQATAQCKNVRLYLGSSPDMIKSVSPALEGRILFWLDAHYSGGKTVMSSDDTSDPDAITAIRNELQAIKDNGISDCIILIDDIRGFGSRINDTEYLGCWAYPTLQEVYAMGKEINPNFSGALIGDIFLMYDATKFSPNLSKTVKACTQSRLYDGHNLSDQELLEGEHDIMRTSGAEKEFIKSLYKEMTGWKDPMFHHDLWYALVSMGEQNWKEALDALEKIPTRVEYFTKRRESVQIQRPYSHWRINSYKERVLQNMRPQA